MRIPILTYRPMHIDGNDYRSNDLCALASDLDHLTAAGYKVKPLRWIIDAWLDNRGAQLDGKLVALTSDNGADFDFADLEHPSAGPQRSLLHVLRDFAAANPGRQDALNVTSFVIASPQAREILDRTCMLGKGWWGDHWWPQAVRTGLIHIGNHSWDHNHETLPPSFVRTARRGTFLAVDSEELAHHEIGTAAEYLGRHVPNPGAGLFAYPYGESNSFLVHEYLPRHAEDLGIRAAFTAAAGFLEPGTGRWEVPRFVCGRDWSSPAGLEAILDSAASKRPWVAAGGRASEQQKASGDSKATGETDELRRFAHFIADHVERIPGWLHAEAALLTAHLAQAQRRLGIAGPTLEIGVYKGKYLSVLYKASSPGEVVLGVDLFVGASDRQAAVEAVRSNVAAACGEAARLKILVADSLELTSGTVSAQAGGEPFRFVSIDGGHTREVVLRDLETACGALRNGGIIALDDVFNALAPGVAEGVCEFFMRRKPALAPFACCLNKLFVTTPDFHGRYLSEALDFLGRITWSSAHRRTLQIRQENRASGFTPMLFGYEVVTFES